MYCKNCNSYVEETSKFCQDCGANIEFEKIPDTKKEEVVVKNKPNYAFMIMLTLLIILIVLFILLFIKAKESREEIMNNPNKVKEILDIDNGDIEYEVEQN